MQAAALLRHHRLDLATEIVDEVAAQVPEYSWQTDPERRAALVETIRRTVAEFADLMGGPATGWPRHMLDLFGEAGAQEARAGRGLDRLQSALRAGARAVLRWLAVQSERLRLPRSMYRAFAEAVFTSLDEFADAAAEGHRRELAKQGDDRVRHRVRLLSLLVTEPSVAPEVIADTAAQADWTVPRTTAALVFAPLRAEVSGPHAEEPVLPSLPAEVLADVRGARPWGVVPDPDRPGGLPYLAELPSPWMMVIGPTVTVDKAAASLYWAKQTLGLVERGIIAWRPGDGPVVHWADHLPTLVLFQREELPRMMAERLLAPLLKLRPREAERLGATLLACLQHGFNVKGAAKTLHVHPQTVRYRINQLQDLFGEDLHATDRRLEMEMALHAWLATMSAQD
ncbi:DNA-binding transcriptional regulator, PucR family [Thermomonospora echinospora]|uniref:DNA-binding transcriptional regulator, PucR family n=1 Tax=Thermomonospora echinospora TaxID=1992 RepID=A0A1H6DYJ4_9ACTN|nr:DNA-binding transcriptional regulator, PucR family [Thermomonospora echinospora]